jgi:hypothetical protein
MSGKALVQWVADGAVEGEAQILVRIQSESFPPRIHVLTPARGWRNDAQLRFHRIGSGSGWRVPEAEARTIAKSWGFELLDAWDDSVPALDEPSSS